MWDGHEVVPSGWAVCDGKEYDGLKTPDLRGKFIKASDSEVGDLDSSHLENADKNEIKLKRKEWYNTDCISNNNNCIVNSCRCYY